MFSLMIFVIYRSGTEICNYPYGVKTFFSISIQKFNYLNRKTFIFVFMSVRFRHPYLTEVFPSNPACGRANRQKKRTFAEMLYTFLLNYSY